MGPGMTSEVLRRVHGSERLPTANGTTDERTAPHETPASLPEEQPLTIEVNGRPVATLLCTPDAPTELGVGWAFAHGFFDDRAQLGRVTGHKDRVSLMVDTAAGGGRAWREWLLAGFDAGTACATRTERQDDEPEADQWRLPPATLDATVAKMLARFGDERAAPAYHHAAVGGGGRVAALARDVSRHNAVDKVVGWALLHELPCARLLLCVSGRLSADIAFKAWRAGLRIVVSRSLPTRQAVSLADAHGLTLVGADGAAERAVYSHPWRLADDESAPAEPSAAAREAVGSTP